MAVRLLTLTGNKRTTMGSNDRRSSNVKVLSHGEELNSDIQAKNA
jgi:hypothetical protein